MVVFFQESDLPSDEVWESLPQVVHCDSTEERNHFLPLQNPKVCHTTDCFNFCFTYTNLSADTSSTSESVSRVLKMNKI
jgi:hypothetical protein